MPKKPRPEPDTRTAAEILREAPPAKRAALIRAAHDELLELLDTTHNAAGFPKEDGRWNSAVCLSLEAVRQRFLNPTREQQHELVS